jgi:nitroimidazol reductase NimA-like FMN-containing flavoprotein (pyridoxamine 5'-phosphate oxidase superfamily)
MDEGPMITGAPAEFFAAARTVALATANGRGEPHVTPVSPVLDLDRIVLATGRDTAKVRNIHENPSVSLSADAYDEDWGSLRGVVVFGEATLIDGGFEWERDRNLLYEKYPQYPEQAPIVEGETVMLDIRIDRIVTWGF